MIRAMQKLRMALYWVIASLLIGGVMIGWFLIAMWMIGTNPPNM